MRRILQTSFIAVALSSAVAVVAATPTPKAGPDATSKTDTGSETEAEKICKPAEMAIVKESLGKTLSAERAAVSATVAASTIVAAGAGRYWEKVRQQWLDARAPKANPAQEARGEPTPEAGTDDARKKEKKEKYGPSASKEELCRALANTDPSRCGAAGAQGAPMCRLLLAARRGSKGCESLTALKGACLFLTGGTASSCSKSSSPEVCKAIARIRAKDALTKCTRNGGAGQLPCSLVAMSRGVAEGSVDPCQTLQSADKQMCSAVVQAKPDACADLDKARGAEAPSGPLRASVQARLLGSANGPPSIVALATADRPALCHVTLTAPATGSTPIWEGVFRVPEYRSLSAVIDAQVQPDPGVASKLDPIAASALTATVRCVDRYYW